MALPTIYFLYNTGTSDTPYPYEYIEPGTSIGDWVSVSGTELVNYKMIFTGGGIEGLLPVPTCISGSRDATIKPTLQPYIIPQTYIEDATTMYNVPMAGFGGVLNAPFKHVFGLHVDGETTSDIFLEAWDDFSFSTTDLEVLKGTANSGGNSFVNAIRTTEAPPEWNPGWSGASAMGAYLRGTEGRLRLKNTSSIANEVVYFNIYILLPTDTVVFHNLCALSFRYLYS